MVYMMTDTEFQDFLTETYGSITIGGITFDAGEILKNMDPTAFRVFMADMECEEE